MKILVIGDIHTKFEKAEKIISHFEKTHKVIAIGDYFDTFNDTAEINSKTAEWLKWSLTQPNRIHIKGNHDQIYDPRYKLFCSGYHTDKKVAINQIMNLDDWNKLNYFHSENGWWFSHAGITEYWFGDYRRNAITVKKVKSVIKDCVDHWMYENGNAIWAAGVDRGGSFSVGSLMWCGWNQLGFLKKTNQVVGHTPVEKIEIKTDLKLKSTLINVDCSRGMRFNQLLEIDEDGNYEIINSD